MNIHPYKSDPQKCEKNERDRAKSVCIYSIDGDGDGGDGKTAAIAFS